MNKISTLIVLVFCSVNAFAAGNKSIQQDTCSPLSTLPCADLKVSLPFSLSFDAAVSSTINDKTGQGTGFRTVNTYTGTRLSADGAPSVSQVPGYEPSKITLTGGQLQLVANKGIDYQNNNNQLNVLGVQLNAAGKLQLDVKLMNPYNGTQAQQGGIWYGLNDKTYIKLGVTGNKIELRKELNDVSSTVTGSANPDQRVTSPITGLSTRTVSLRLVVDSAAQTAEGFYSTDGVTYTSAGAMGYSQSSLNLSGTGLTAGVLYAGIFATYRNGTVPVTYTFDDFSIKSIAVPPFNGCMPLSTLPCADLKVSLPFSLSFDAAVSSTINDKTGQGTGFRTVNTYTGTRLSADGAPSVSQVPGYEPSKITLTGGQLQLVANKGIDYQNNNNQLNVLGVQLNAAGKLQLDVKLMNPYNGTQAQQGGIWYGLNDKTYIKLGVTGNKIELRKELNDVSSTVTGSANPDQRVTSPITGLSTRTVSLRLVVDSAAQTAEGFYSTDGVTYTSAGAMGYSQSSLNLSGTGLTAGVLYAGIFATYRNGTVPVTYTFDDFSIINPLPAQKTLAFSTDTLNFTVLKDGQILPQSVNLIASPATSSFTLTKTEASWLTLPQNPSSTITFNSSNISSTVAPGSYQALITCTADGYLPATLFVNLNVIERADQKTININFQDAQTVPPLGYVIDYGQPYGERTGKNQATGLTYGWRKRSDGSLLSLVGNGRVRTMPEDILLATLMHMQANNIPGTFQGVKTEGYWELKVPNGTYDATVSVGDGSVSAATEIHYINIEGVNAISGFIPKGKQGDIGRFKSNTIRVNVTDENLTINANGGTNTKINFANIVPVTTYPYLYWAANTRNLVIEKGTPTDKSFSMVLGSSDNSASAYTVTATYTGGNTPWLTYNQSPAGTQPVITFNYSSAKNLPLGIYYATVKASASSFTGAQFTVQLSVVDSLRPYVISSNPPNGAVNVSLLTVSVAANNLHVPAVPGFQGGVDNSTIKDSTVMLYKIADGTSVKVAGNVQGTGGGDAISFSPTSSLEPNTRYKFVITSGVKSYSGAAFVPFESVFTTDAAQVDSSSFLYAQFTKVGIPGTQNIKYSSLTIGPDDKFYALRLDGIIERYDINHSDGSLTNKISIKTLNNKYGKRTAIGLAFDPNSTPSNLILWVSHSSDGLSAAPAFDGNISRLQGDSLQNEQLMITKLPRSTRDHLVNSVAFGPDGALYICQGSNSSAGSYDNDWQRDESLLSGTVLRLDINKLNTFPLPLNVQTTANQTVINNAPAADAAMSDGTYNPYGSNSPLTIYASGVRNAFDLLWHSNGQLYLPTNGSGGGGNSPASVTGTRRPDGTFYNGPAIPATTGVKVQNDWLFRVNPDMPVGYYGHPNPLRGEYVINRGYADNPLYLPSVTADASYRPAYNFGLNHSPNGVIEYKSNNFNGALKGKILVCRFSGGGDIEVMEPRSLIKDPTATNDSIYNIIKVNTGSGNTGLTGMSGFTNPLDIVEDITNGNLYVNEYNWNDNPNLTGQITLLRAQVQPAPAFARLALASTPEIIANNNNNESANYWITIMNKGDADLKVKNISLNGQGASEFKIAGIPLPSSKAPLVLRKNSSLSFKVNANAAISKAAIAKLRVISLDDTVKEVEISNKIIADSVLSSNNTDTYIDKIISNTKKTEREMVVYPNPNHGEPLNIFLKNFRKQEAVTLYLFNKIGQQLKVLKATTNLNGEYHTSFSIDANDSVGFYVVRAVYSSGAKFAKIIVNK